MFALLFFINIAFALPNHYSLEQDRHLNSRKVYLTPKQTHKKLTRAHKLMSDKSTVDQAIKYLKDLEHKVSQRPYELALVKQNLGYAYVNKNEMNKALKIFDEALALKVLPSAVTKTLMYNAARILTSLNQFDEAQKRLQEWFAVTEKPAAQAYVLMARILFEKKQKKEALEYVDYAISKSTKPQEDWLQLSVALNYELKNYKAVATSLEYLTAQYPKKKNYWKQLSGVYLHLNNYAKSLATLELARKWGHLETEAEMLNLVSLFLMESYPYQAGKLLSQWIKEGRIKDNKKNYEILANAWMQSEELTKALEPLAKAAEQSEDGQLWLQLGQINMELEKWEDAIDAIEKSLAKGHLKKPGVALISLGISYFSLGNTKKAHDAFEKALKTPDMKKSAEQWLQHLAMM